MRFIGAYFFYHSVQDRPIRPAKCMALKRCACCVAFFTRVSISGFVIQNHFSPVALYDTWGRWLSTEHPAVSGTGPLQLLPQECGTVCRQTYEKKSYHTPGSGGRWRHFHLDSPNFLTAPCRNIVTYLLTYLLTRLPRQFDVCHVAKCSMADILPQNTGWPKKVSHYR